MTHLTIIMRLKATPLLTTDSAFVLVFGPSRPVYKAALWHGRELNPDHGDDRGRDTFIFHETSMVGLCKLPTSDRVCMIGAVCYRHLVQLSSRI